MARKGCGEGKNSSMPVEVQYIDNAQGRSYVIDSAIDEATLNWMDEFRRSLPLDSKRPTVDRRFFADGSHINTIPHVSSSLWMSPDRPMAHILEVAIQQSIGRGRAAAGEEETGRQHHFQEDPKFCHVFRYQRFLEYTKKGSKLDPHTDGTKICDDTQLTSTHTLLLYLTDCQKGGETLLMTECTKELPDSSEQTKADGTVLYATQPRRGRILLFPHATPHAGATVVDVPKICLRAEVCLIEEP
jgi:hypothetical protein